MTREEVQWFSQALNRNMEIIVYGNSGVPVLGFPTQNSKCRNYEDFGLIHQIADYLDQGKMQLFVVDSVDEESWSNESGNPEWRAARQEQYYHYVVDEVIPFIRSRNDQPPVAMGFSMGANHAANFFLRRPDLFSGVLALSGVYDSDYFFHGWMNSTLYDNSPERYMPGLPKDHFYVDMYNHRTLIFCVGQGAWEEDGVRTLRHLERVFQEKGIHAWCDFWGYDVNHDWPWWYRQARYFLPRFWD